jgi:hypothetical protein
MKINQRKEKQINFQSQKCSFLFPINISRSEREGKSESESNLKAIKKDKKSSVCVSVYIYRGEYRSIIYEMTSKLSSQNIINSQTEGKLDL